MKVSKHDLMILLVCIGKQHCFSRLIETNHEVVIALSLLDFTQDRDNKSSFPLSRFLISTPLF